MVKNVGQKMAQKKATEKVTEWTNIDDEFTIDDIGARLLANLARGIYNHEAVLREYVQNACDALRASSSTPTHAAIKISIDDDDAITIHDDGIGMDEQAIKESKKIAVSPKAGKKDMTGFRGIGIWAGFQACKRLEIVTTKLGTPYRYRLELDFGEISKHVDEDINIKSLLDNRFRITRDEAPANEHYTRVTLHDLVDEYLKLTDKAELRRIVSAHLPCKIDPAFPYADKINEKIHAFDGYQEYSILVDNDEVFKEFPSEVGTPQFKDLIVGGAEYGRAWYCTGTHALKTKTAGQFRGFRMRIRNFAVGRASIYDDEYGSGFGITEKVKLGSPIHLSWHVGEIHITHPDVIPDTPRSALELDQISRRAIVAVREFYDDRIADSRAIADFKKFDDQVERAELLLKKEKLFVDPAELRDLVQSLQEQDRRAREAADNKVKRRVKERLNSGTFRRRRHDALKALQETLDEMGQSTPPPSEPTSKSGNGKSGNAKKSAATASAASEPIVDSDFDYEKLLSDIFAVVEDKLGEDDELVRDMCLAIQEVFQKNGIAIGTET